tara:strand:- start:119 stop:424 length:306 start_codon:yes stop_codon:yes gene_type:complete
MSAIRRTSFWHGLSQSRHARVASPLSSKTALALRAEAARQIMEVIMQQEPILPITKSQRRALNDEKGSSRYAKRTAIDSLLAERKLQKQLREVWDDPLHSA